MARSSRPTRPPLWTKPPAGTILNPLSPITNGLAAAFLLNEGAGTRLFSLGQQSISSVAFEAVTPPAWGFSTDGNALVTTNAGGSRVLITPGTANWGLSPAGLNNLTLSAVLVFTASGSGITQYVLSLGAVSTATYWIGYSSASSGLVAKNAGGTAAVLSGLPPVGTRLHLTGVFRTDGTMSLYLNGVLAASGTGASAAANALNLYIGGSPAGGPPDALISSVFLWNRALRAEEVQALYTDPYSLTASVPVILPSYTFGSTLVPSGQLIENIAVTVQTPAILLSRDTLIASSGTNPVVPLAFVNNIPAASGLASQTHMAFCQNVGLWWNFWYDSTQPFQVQSEWSSDLLTWNPGPPGTLAQNHNNEGRQFSVAYANIASTDVLHFAIDHVVAGTGSDYHLRATATGTTINWDTENVLTSAVASILTPDISGPGVTISRNNIVMVTSEWLASAALGYGNFMVVRNVTADPGGASWTPGTWDDSAGGAVTSSGTGNSLINERISNGFAAVPLVGGNVLVLGQDSIDADASYHGADLHWSLWNGTSWSVVATALASHFSGTYMGVNDWGWVGFTGADIHIVVRNPTGNGFTHRRFNGTTWIAGDTNIQPHTSLGGTTLDNGGIALTTNGTSIWAWIIDSAPGNAIYNCRWQSGTGWGPWTAQVTSPASRSFLTGARASATNTVIIWMEGGAGAYTLMGMHFSVSVNFTGTSTLLPTGTLTRTLNTAVGQTAILTIGYPGPTLLGTLDSPERALYYGTPSDGSYARIGASIGQIDNTTMWRAMKTSAIKLMYSRFQQFQSDDNTNYAFFPYTSFINYNNAQIALGQPSLLITATYLGVKYQVYDYYHLAVVNNKPTGPTGQWQSLVNFLDDRFINWWYANYVVPIVFALNLPNQWMSLDNGTFRYGEYGIVDNTNTFRDGVVWDSPFPQSGSQFAVMVSNFFIRVGQLYPNLNLTVNEGTLDDYTNHFSIYSNMAGFDNESVDSYYASGAASLRADMYQRLIDDYAITQLGKLGLFKWIFVTNDSTLPTQMLRDYCHYLMLHGPRTFFVPQFNVPEVAPSNYATIAQSLGLPTAGTVITPAAGHVLADGYNLYSRQMQGGIAYLNWTGAAKNVVLPAGNTYVDHTGTAVTSVTIPDQMGEYVLYVVGATSSLVQETFTRGLVDTFQSTLALGISGLAENLLVFEQDTLLSINGTFTFTNALIPILYLHFVRASSENIVTPVGVHAVWQFTNPGFQTINALYIDDQAPIGSQSTLASPNLTPGAFILFAQFCSLAFSSSMNGAVVGAGQWTAGLATRGVEPGNHTMQPVLAVGVVNGSTGVVRGWILNGVTYNAPVADELGEITHWSATDSNLIGSGVTVSTGDYLVVEVGWKPATSGSWVSETLYFNGSTPIAVDDVATTSARSYLICPSPLAFTSSFIGTSSFTLASSLINSLAPTVSRAPTLNYPRLANVGSLSVAGQVPDYTPYGLVVASHQATNGSPTALRTLKNTNPTCRALLLQTTDTVGMGDGNYTISPGWWLTLAGTTLTASINDTVSTVINVSSSVIINNNLSTNPDIIIDSESMHVTAVDTVNNLLTVQRGYYSIATTHSVGARVAAHATRNTTSWMLNITPACPLDPVTNLNWISYLVNLTASWFGLGAWDGVYLQNAVSDISTLSGGQVDSTNDNIADGGTGLSGIGWLQGQIALASALRAALPGAHIMGDEGYYPGASDGIELEAFPTNDVSWAFGLQRYLQAAGPTAPDPMSIIHPDTGNTGTQSYQTMREGLATALMGNGYFSYDYGRNIPGQTWWYDEYDNGAGSSLAGSINNSTTTITVATGTGTLFSINNILFVPNTNSGDLDNEQMLVTGIATDTLTVTRGYNNSTADSHVTGTKVYTQAQLALGLGWLGQPIGVATSLITLGSTTLTNGSFETTGASWFSPWGFSVSGPAAATLTQDPAAPEAGTYAARIDVSVASPANTLNIVLSQSGMAVTSGTAYTLTFWARAATLQSIDVLIRQSTSPNTVYSNVRYMLSTTWAQYTLTVVAPATETHTVLLAFARQVGTVWIDNVQYQSGDPNFYLRTFTGGIAILNATASSQSVFVGSGYRTIAGTQAPGINTGAVTTTATVPANDGLLLVRQPPVFIVTNPTLANSGGPPSLALKDTMTDVLVPQDTFTASSAPVNTTLYLHHTAAVALANLPAGVFAAWDHTNTGFFGPSARGMDKIAPVGSQSTIAASFFTATNKILIAQFCSLPFDVSMNGVSVGAGNWALATAHLGAGSPLGMQPYVAVTLVNGATGASRGTIIALVGWNGTVADSSELTFYSTTVSGSGVTASTGDYLCVEVGYSPSTSTGYTAETLFLDGSTDITVTDTATSSARSFIIAPTVINFTLPETVTSGTVTSSISTIGLYAQKAVVTSAASVSAASNTGRYVQVIHPTTASALSSVSVTSFKIQKFIINPATALSVASAIGYYVFPIYTVTETLFGPNSFVLLPLFANTTTLSAAVISPGLYGFPVIATAAGSVSTTSLTANEPQSVVAVVANVASSTTFLWNSIQIVNVTSAHSVSATSNVPVYAQKLTVSAGASVSSNTLVKNLLDFVTAGAATAVSTTTFLGVRAQPVHVTNASTVSLTSSIGDRWYQLVVSTAASAVTNTTLISHVTQNITAISAGTVSSTSANALRSLPITANVASTVSSGLLTVKYSSTVLVSNAYSTSSALVLVRGVQRVTSLASSSVSTVTLSAQYAQVATISSAHALSSVSGLITRNAQQVNTTDIAVLSNTINRIIVYAGIVTQAATTISSDLLAAQLFMPLTAVTASSQSTATGGPGRYSISVHTNTTNSISAATITVHTTQLFMVSSASVVSIGTLVTRYIQQLSINMGTAVSTVSMSTLVGLTVPTASASTLSAATVTAHGVQKLSTTQATAVSQTLERAARVLVLTATPARATSSTSLVILNTLPIVLTHGSTLSNSVNIPIRIILLLNVAAGTPVSLASITDKETQAVVTRAGVVQSTTQIRPINTLALTVSTASSLSAAHALAQYEEGVFPIPAVSTSTAGVTGILAIKVSPAAPRALSNVRLTGLYNVTTTPATQQINPTIEPNPSSTMVTLLYTFVVTPLASGSISSTQNSPGLFAGVLTALGASALSTAALTCTVSSGTIPIARDVRTIIEAEP